jgi:hypothetical protein
MVQRREYLRFALESGESIGIDNALGWQNLERNLTLQHWIARAVDVRHATGVDPLENFVVAD